MLKKIQIGGLDIFPNIFLAPMAGVTDIHFRRVVRSFGGCGLSTSELISSEGMVRQQPRTLKMLDFPDEEHPFGIQIYGARPNAMAEAAEMAVASGADLVDINVGCPARKVVRNMCGSYLLKDPPLLRKIIQSVRAAVAIPLTVKIRSGFSEDSINYLEIGKMAEDCGVDAVVLHPRTRAQQFSGRAKWNYIGRLKSALSIPVIGNGDIFTPGDALEMFRQTGCDAVMVGRGIMKNPWLIRQIFDLASFGSFSENSPRQALALCLDFARTLFEKTPEKKITGEMKKYCSWLVHGFPGASRLRQRLYSIREPEGIIQQLEDLISKFSEC